ncbi:branched-chain amino acid ABC transporter permease [Metarhizobium album]|uniref:Branched-chain amino acid ABC transporter permease n=1 Tax=Metarhizobium album TaxID=2182425 RepID=A0A2U2DSA4_9HYPH|nr:branched-chain amino acid ABC transporter permease [Rhizobium album]PWE56205.1 branched-chain amino acid ABC transporter permease [Rhizobium album]
MLDLLNLGLAGYIAFFLATALSYSILCLGLNLQWGQTGLFNVGVAGFAAVGAYTSAILTTPPSDMHFGGFGLPIVVGWGGAMLVSAAVTGFIGLATLRLRSDYLAIATFGVAVTIQLVALNAQWLTGGPFGIGFIPRMFGGLAGNALAFNFANLATIAVVVLVLYLALERLVRSPWGRVLRAVREDEEAATSLGKSPARYRLQAFVLGGAIMGLGGAVQAHFIGFIAPENYLPTLTFQVWTMLIIGGSGNNLGAILGGVVIWALWALSGSAIQAIFPPEQQARAAALQITGIGVLLSVALILRPRGLLGEKIIVSRHMDLADTLAPPASAKAE